MEKRKDLAKLITVTSNGFQDIPKNQFYGCPNGKVYAISWHLDDFGLNHLLVQCPELYYDYQRDEVLINVDKRQPFHKADFRLYWRNDLPILKKFSDFNDALEYLNSLPD